MKSRGEPPQSKTLALSGLPSLHHPARNDKNKIGRADLHLGHSRPSLGYVSRRVRLPAISKVMSVTCFFLVCYRRQFFFEINDFFYLNQEPSINLREVENLLDGEAGPQRV